MAEPNHAGDVQLSAVNVETSYRAQEAMADTSQSSPTSTTANIHNDLLQEQLKHISHQHGNLM